MPKRTLPAKNMTGFKSVGTKHRCLVHDRHNGQSVTSFGAWYAAGICQYLPLSRQFPAGFPQNIPWLLSLHLSTLSVRLSRVRATAGCEIMRWRPFSVRIPLSAPSKQNGHVKHNPHRFEAQHVFSP